MLAIFIFFLLFFGISVTYFWLQFLLKMKQVNKFKHNINFIVRIVNKIFKEIFKFNKLFYTKLESLKAFSKNAIFEVIHYYKINDSIISKCRKLILYFSMLKATHNKVYVKENLNSVSINQILSIKINSIKNILKRIYYNIMIKLTIWPLTKHLNITLIYGIILRILYYRFSITQANFWPIISNPIDNPSENYYNREWDAVDVNFNPSKTLYEEMNGDSDPNKSAQDTSSESESEEEIMYSPVIIFDAYKTHMKNCSSSGEMVKRSLDFVHTQFPHELLAKTKEELGSPESQFNVFQDQLIKEININTQVDAHLLLFFQAGLATYNAATLLDILEKPESQQVIEQIYFATIKQIVDKRNS
jgi:hypothetical protein